MKFFPVIPAIAVFGLAACETMTGPLTSGDFDPLRPPGGNVRSASQTTGLTYKAGQFVKTTIDNASFFKVRPKGNANADKLLKRGASMKVVSNSGSYAKVELDSGEIGFIAAVVLESADNTAPQPQGMAPGQYQVYPPLPGAGGGTPLPSSTTGMGEPLPPIDPRGLPPEGAIPTVIDPEAPASLVPVPAVTPGTETFPTPPVQTPADLTPVPPIEVKPEGTSTPLPPNGEE
jgi:hypothetical protein